MRRDAADIAGGPNCELSLVQGRRKFVEFGASRRPDLPHVRSPRPDEHPSM
ncbi:hypothetical protein E1292_11085 [Nonomuraea deserti]|uniref:Cysteine-rich CPCC domain-containing protein n=1 Tax=Nonomuraea deserti TaxID=1848322 RepID=A0A4R4VRX8_9ACTN|nr:hypothetical protein E1292_11085 [Nonomuraea deserti]